LPLSPSPPSPLPPRSPFPLNCCCFLVDCCLPPLASVSIAIAIAFSADIAAAFWLIVVCPRLSLFRS
jgi:hypothetical protein